MDRGTERADGDSSTACGRGRKWIGVQRWHLHASMEMDLPTLRAWSSINKVQPLCCVAYRIKYVYYFWDSEKPRTHACNNY